MQMAAKCGAHKLATPQGSAWQDQVRLILTKDGNAVAQVLNAGEMTSSLVAHLIKSSGCRLCCRISTGKATGVIKIFGDEDLDDQYAFERERDVLIEMKDTGLVPRLKAYSDPNQWLLMEDVGNADAIHTFTPVEFARKLGVWIAEFEAVAPCQQASGNWLGYFRKLGLEGPLRAIDGAEETLAQTPLCGLVLSRNDPALHNHLQRADGRLLGCDFEKSTLRPRGWDYVNTWQALVERFPDNVDDVLPAFYDGFDHAHRGGLIMAELNAVARIFFLAQFWVEQNRFGEAA